ncbi:MAG TPA: FAD-dependent oxidoreductase [Nordella sp.]|nr:FAD-dependent oxidoreductase [Nordella sp.]
MKPAQGMVIIGAGDCGMRAALALREEGYAGAITLVSDEAHAPYERPPLSKDLITSPVAEARTTASPEALAGKHITFIGDTRATVLHPRTRTVALSDGRLLRYEKLLLATGAEPRRLTGIQGARAHYLRSFDDLLVLRRKIRPGVSIAIAGGGFIGLEVAAAACRLGAKVRVIEAQERILKRGVPAEIAKAVARLHRREGVQIITGRSDMPDADLIIAGIGAIPRTRLAEAAGLRIDNGIAVDAELRSSDPHIFAAGDCCSFPCQLYDGLRIRLEAWCSALDQGRRAARNMLGFGDRDEAVPWFWSDQFDWRLEIAGLIDEGHVAVRRDMGEGGFILFHLGDDGRLVAAGGFGPGTQVARDMRIAEKMIARRQRPDPARLAAAEVKLKSLMLEEVIL